ncbi:class I SAM-dependent methyltransferase [Saccharothrix longispora]|uniref:class I SAM-dependent methyltransferase n=1 Tax=Saccharothrix longispora TaxID=33920 RepID=UPI0028FD5182|nr:class I SAM-dependent methyltransferase [Saccharothrix longispora]MDU0293032.1 class I SAM-dependent methyltransferase [Saccharothrix longispora]
MSHGDSDTAERAFSFGLAARAYADLRPSYPVEAVRWGLNGTSGPVLDLAAGTGKLTECLAVVTSDVVAVEPDADMRAELERRLPGVTALDGVAEAIPLPDESVDAVFVGQALHWFDLEPALTEIARVLRPSGALVALWNHDDTSVPWVAEFAALARTTTASRHWADPLVPLPAHPRFAAFERRRYPNPQPFTAESLVRMVCTQSHMLLATPGERERRVAELHGFLADRPATSSGGFELPMVTTAIRAVRP